MTATTGCKANESIKLGIWGLNQFDDTFDKFKGKPFDRCFLEISEISESQSLDQFQAVFISISEKAGLQEILARLKPLPVLIIGDSPGYMQAGVMINLIQRDDKLGFEINMKIAKAAGLKISSQLLKLASDIQE
ncbi:MAG: YfiR family protein [Deltaproteobacteria bacterium]|nr:YfiR family protein [Deltaproteobacteria bacterium]